MAGCTSNAFLASCLDAKAHKHKQSTAVIVHHLDQHLARCRAHIANSLVSFSAATCSSYGVCLSTVSTTTTNTAPTIALRTTTALPATVNVKQYSTYAACASGASPTTAVPCELGATATDTQDGTLTSVVNTCAPSTCTSTSSCSGANPAHSKAHFAYCKV